MADGIERFDVLVVGGGPAGLGAAIILGRCRRSVLVCDAGKPRNAVSRGIHGLLGHDGLPPGDFLKKAREEVRKYGVIVRDVEVVDVRRIEGGFEADLAGGARVSARKVVLATGMVDVIPPIEGVRECYGRGVHHCPHCDGWEVQGEPLGVLGPGDNATSFSLQLLRWSDDIILFTHGPASLSDENRSLLERNGVAVREEPIARVVGDGERLTSVELCTGEVIPRRALFLKTGEAPGSPLPAKLGCRMDGQGVVDAGFEGTAKPVVKADRGASSPPPEEPGPESRSVEGVFVVGDASPRVQFVAVASAEGAAAAVRINAILQQEDLGLR